MKTAHIYFLLKNGEIIYVGRTINLRSRIVCHRRDKDFDTYRAIECPRKKVAQYEERWIKRFKPRYNKVLLNGKKLHFSLTLRPELIRKIDGKVTPDKGRNRLIEETLQEKFI